MFFGELYKKPERLFKRNKFKRSSCWIIINMIMRCFVQMAIYQYSLVSVLGVHNKPTKLKSLSSFAFRQPEQFHIEHQNFSFQSLKRESFPENPRCFHSIHYPSFSLRIQVLNTY